MMSSPARIVLLISLIAVSSAAVARLNGAVQIASGGAVLSTLLARQSTSLAPAPGVFRRQTGRMIFAPILIPRESA